MRKATTPWLRRSKGGPNDLPDPPIDLVYSGIVDVLS